DFMERDDFIAKIPSLLNTVHKTLWDQAKAMLDKNTRTDIKDFADFKKYFESKNEFLGDKGKVGFVRAPWSADIEATEKALDELAVTIRCIPLDQPKELGTCVITGKPATCEAVFGRNY